MAMGARNMRHQSQNEKLATVNLLNPQESKALPVPLRFRDIKTAVFLRENPSKQSQDESPNDQRRPQILHGFSSNVQKFGKSPKV